MNWKKKNQELLKRIHQLKDMEAVLETSEANWRMLGGENIPPYYIEVYDEDETLIFDNNNIISPQKCLDKQLHNERYRKQVIQSLSSGMSDTQIYDIVSHVKHCYFEVKTIPTTFDGQVRCMAIIGGDITDRKEYEEDILYIGYHDQLTDLRNRHYFRSNLEHLNKEKCMPISIIMGGDVNGLKMINDSFGHTMGDRLLVESAAIMGKYLSDSDVLARWGGGDEYIVLLPNTDKDRVNGIIKSIKEEIVNVKVDDSFPISIALGEATAYDTAFEFEELIKEAEDKMYVNKLKDQLSYRSSVVESLKQALYERDYETEEHTERLCDMALLMAKHLGLGQNDKDRLSLLGDLHDIGKIALPSSVLNKKKGLSLRVNGKVSNVIQK